MGSALRNKRVVFGSNAAVHGRCVTLADSSGVTANISVSTLIKNSRLLLIGSSKPSIYIDVDRIVYDSLLLFTMGKQSKILISDPILTKNFKYEKRSKNKLIQKAQNEE